MAEIIDWPCSLLRVTYQRMFIRNVSRSAGVSMLGQDQIIDTGAQWWEVQLSLTAYHEAPMIKAFEAKVSQMRGRANIAALCLFDAYGYDETVAPRQRGFSDGTWFSDGRGFADPSSGVQPLVVASTAAAGSNSLTVSLTDPVRPHLRIGDYFSVNGFCYHVVGRDVAAGSVRFEPMLREGIAAGTILETARPTIYARFASDDEGKRGRNLTSHAEPVTLSFVEAFDR